ncbi:MAG: hypothetical protein M0C28_43575 [Candidatus Moduliflexus flocculans]|nr:hypothetical protein [Candidatus Moduliflexus flocculans]
MVFTDSLPGSLRASRPWRRGSRNGPTPTRRPRATRRPAPPGPCAWPWRENLRA